AASAANYKPFRGRVSSIGGTAAHDGGVRPRAQVVIRIAVPSRVQPHATSVSASGCPKGESRYVRRRPGGRNAECSRCLQSGRQAQASDPNQWRLTVEMAGGRIEGKGYRLLEPRRWKEPGRHRSKLP